MPAHSTHLARELDTVDVDRIPTEIQLQFDHQPTMVQPDMEFDRGPAGRGV